MKGKDRRFMLSDFKVYFNDGVIKKAWYLAYRYTYR